MLPTEQDIQIIRGVTWNPVLQWLSETPTHKVISNVAIGLPTLVTATAHGITGSNRVPVWITDVQGPRGLNTDDYTCAEPRWAIVVDSDTLAVEFDSASLSAYTKGGVLTYRAPIDLTGWSASQKLYDAIGSSNVLNELNTSNGGITLGADGTITLVLAAEASAAMALTSGWYKLELTDPNGVVTRVAEGNASIADTALG